MRILKSARVFVVALVLLCVARAPSSGSPSAFALPFDRSCPVILDNDWAVDQYDLPYAMALASAGKITLRGIVASNSYDEQYLGDASGNTMRNYYLPNYQHLVNVGRSSGFTNVPDPVEGPHLSLKRPASGNIDETVPQDTPGTRLILAEARKATVAKPLVIVQGGQCTAAVSAYLLDHSIADKLVLAWLVGNVNEYSNNDYNGYVDSWGAYIALQRLRAVTVGYHGNPGLASIPAARLRSDYPNNPLKTELLKIADGTGDAGQQFGPINFDADGVGLTLIMHPEYILSSSGVVFDYFYTVSGHQMCHYRNDGASRYTFVTQGSATVYTNSWWEAMLDPAAYHTTSGAADLVITSFSYANGVFQCTAKNQGSAPTPSGGGIGVAYSVDGAKRTWGAYSGVLAAGASVNIGTDGGAYIIPDGTHTISALVDDVFVVPESNENNNVATQTITIGGGPGLPDVIVTSLTYSNGVFTSTVKNQGSGPTPTGIGIGVGYFVDGVQRTWGSVSGPLSPGASVTVGTQGGSYVIPDGTHTIRAWVDDVNRFPESVETNNDYSQTITIGSGPSLPDVIVTSLTYSNGVFTSTVKNQGSVPTPQGIVIGVGYFVDGTQRTWGSVMGPLAAGASMTIGTHGGSYVIPNGTHTIRAWADDVNRFPESVETNNDLSQTITVGTGPAMADVILTSFSYSNGVFSCTAKNQGSAPTPSTSGIGVAYSVDGVYRTWGAYSGVLAPGQSVNIGTNGGSYVIPSGTHGISALVDDVHVVPESDESNNTLARTVTIGVTGQVESVLDEDGVPMDLGDFLQNPSTDGGGGGGSCGATGLELLLALALAAICRAGGSCRRSRP